MVGQLYLLAVTILLVLALAITLPVLRNIVREGLERHRDRKTADVESETAGSDELGDDSDGVGKHCPHCGTVNDGEYRFCQRCAEQL
jgi:hypothetical protein